jgi:hypothetical protein
VKIYLGITQSTFVILVKLVHPVKIGVIDEVKEKLRCLKAPRHILRRAVLIHKSVVPSRKASYADQHIKGGFDMVLDDLLAGVYAWMALQIIINLLPFSGR